MEFERSRHNHTHMNIAPLKVFILSTPTLSLPHQRGRVSLLFLYGPNLNLFFIKLLTISIQEPAIRIRLPESKTSEAKNERIKTVLITQEGEIYFMDRRVSLQDIQTTIKGSLNDPEKDFLRIKADRDVHVSLLIHVIDEVRLSGIKNFSIVTERR